MPKVTRNFVRYHRVLRAKLAETGNSRDSGIPVHGGLSPFGVGRWYRNRLSWSNELSLPYRREAQADGQGYKARQRLRALGDF